MPPPRSVGLELGPSPRALCCAPDPTGRGGGGTSGAFGVLGSGGRQSRCLRFVPELILCPETQGVKGGGCWQALPGSAHPHALLVPPPAAVSTSVFIVAVLILLLLLYHRDPMCCQFLCSCRFFQTPGQCVSTCGSHAHPRPQLSFLPAGVLEAGPLHPPARAGPAATPPAPRAASKRLSSSPGTLVCRAGLLRAAAFQGRGPAGKGAGRLGAEADNAAL